MTKLCQSLEHLQVAWNSRPNKKVKLTKIEVKHPIARGMDPEVDAANKSINIDNSDKADIGQKNPF